MSSNKPVDAGFVTWQYSGDSLIVQTSNFDVIDSLKITFIQAIPTSLSEDNSYTGSYDAELDSSSKKLATGGVNWDVDVVGNSVSYYALTPAGDSTITAGDSIAYTLTAYDQFGNTVANSDSVTLTAVGSDSAGFSPGPYEFSGLDTLAFKVSDFVVGSFTVRVNNIDIPTLSVQSGLITIDPAAERFAKFAELFAGDRHDPLKDVGDAGRYAIERAIKSLPATQLVARY